MRTFDDFKMNESAAPKLITTVSPELQKLILEDLSPLIDSYGIEVDEMKVSRNASSEANLSINTKAYDVVRGSWVAGTFFNAKDAQEVLEILMEKDCSVVVDEHTEAHPGVRIKESSSGVYLGVRAMITMARSRNLDLDLIDINTKFRFLLENPEFIKLWKKGMTVSQFKERYKSALSLKKFGI